MDESSHKPSDDATTSPDRGASALAAKVAFLKRPESYAEGPRRVEAVETHMSWVFLTDDHAYKMKKPVVYDFLDFRTPALRRRSCEEEVRLNRRLAPDVYIGVVPLTLDLDGGLHLGGFGEPIDWLVRMYRLSAHLMLDNAIAAHRARRDRVRGVGFLLADFYKAAAPVDVGADRHRERFAQEIEANRRELCDPAYDLPTDRIEAVSDRQRGFLARHADILGRRVRERRIVEAHGDLRPEHIHLGPPPQIIDCLEFRREFRILDPADELSFLALEAERLGAPKVGRLVFEVYGHVTDDRPPERLIRFYKSYRACLRAKIAIWHLREADARTPERWPALAHTYLALAEHYAEDLA